MGASLIDPDDVLDLAEEVERALRDFDPVRTAHHPIRVRVQTDGRVILQGPVRSRLVRDQILEIVRSVPGVVEGIDRMVPDAELEVAVAEALDRDPRTSSLPPGGVQTHALFGAITLSGHLPAGSDRGAVRQVAAAVPGVRQVHDRLT